MISRAKQELIRLSEFAGVRFLPAIQGAESPGQSWVENYSLGELLEAVSWLVVGVQIGYFPHDAADALWNVHKGRIIKRINDYLKLRMDFYSPALAEDLRERASRGGLLPPQAPEEERDSGRLDAVFDAGLLLSTGMQDQLGRLSAAAMLFAPERDWEKIEAYPPTPGQVEEALGTSDAGIAAITPALLLAGLWKNLDHMGASRAHFETIDVSVIDAEVPSYRQINAWRFNFTSDRFSKRFSVASEMLADVAARQNQGSSAGFRARFLDDIRALARNWDTNHPFYLANVGTA